MKQQRMKNKEQSTKTTGMKKKDLLFNVWYFKNFLVDPSFAEKLPDSSIIISPNARKASKI